MSFGMQRLGMAGELSLKPETKILKPEETQSLSPKNDF